MLFKCWPPGAQIPGRFPGPVHARGKWFTVDIHCHVLTPKAAEMVAGNADATRHPREVYANERTREVPTAGSDYPLPPLDLAMPPPPPRRAAISAAMSAAVSANGGPPTSQEDGHGTA